MALLSNRFLIFWRLRNRDKARSGAQRQTANSCLTGLLLRNLISVTVIRSKQQAACCLWCKDVKRAAWSSHHCILQQSSVKKHFFHRYKTPQLSFLLACSAVLEWFQAPRASSSRRRSSVSTPRVGRTRQRALSQIGGAVTQGQGPRLCSRANPEQCFSSKASGEL